MEGFFDGGRARYVGVARGRETLKIFGFLAADDRETSDDHSADQGAEDVEHRGGGLVLHGGEDEDLRVVLLILLEIGRESGAAGGIVGAVEEQIGLTSDELEPAGPDGGAGARIDATRLHAPASGGPPALGQKDRGGRV